METSNIRILLLSFVVYFGFISVANGSMVSSNYANNFYVAYLRQLQTTSRIDMIVLTESVPPVQFSISSLNGSIHNGTTTRDTPAVVTLPSSLQVRETTFNYRQLGLLVTSPPDEPISLVLVGWTSTPRSTYLALPCIEQPTQEYVYYGVSNEALSNAHYSQILLVGCRDDTTVTITPTHNVQLPGNPQLSNSSLVNVAAGSSHTVTLHSLQTLLIAAVDVDLSGTKIASNRPLTVVGGHDCANVPATYDDCDPINTQVPPTINWGTQFLIAPFNGRTNGQRLKMIASENATSLNITCPSQSSRVITLNQTGAFYDVDITTANEFCTCECTKPCYLSELAFGSSYPVLNFGDPLLMTVPPISQYPHSVTFTTLPDMPNNYYSIAVPADSYYNGTVIINGILTTLNWTPIRNTNGVITGYGYNTTANGSYTISHSHPNGKIYVSAYGFQRTGGYGYLAGTNLKPLLFITFNSSNYFTDEQVGHVFLYIERTNRLSENITVTVRTMSTTANEHSDYVPLNKTVTFSTGETIKTLSVTILNDQVTEETEYFDVIIETLVDAAPFQIDKTTVAIEGIDSIVFGLRNSLMSVSDRERVPIDVLVVSGKLQLGLTVVLSVEIESSQGQTTNVSFLYFQYGISEMSIVFNATQLLLSFDLKVRLLVHTGTAQVNTSFNISQANITFNSAVPMPTTTMSITKTNSVRMSTIEMTSVVSTMQRSSSTSNEPSPTMTPMESCRSGSSSIKNDFSSILVTLVLVTAAVIFY